jgi:fatty acid desaturase
MLSLQRQENKAMSKPGYKDQSMWIRLVFMALYWGLINLAVCVFGFLLVIVTVIKLASRYEPYTLGGWLTSLSTFIQQSFRFLAFQTEEKPFPFQAWPNGDDNGH